MLTLVGGQGRQLGRLEAPTCLVGKDDRLEARGPSRRLVQEVCVDCRPASGSDLHLGVGDALTVELGRDGLLDGLPLEITSTSRRTREPAASAGATANGDTASPAATITAARSVDTMRAPSRPRLPSCLLAARAWNTAL
jgi:hypothetical protein